MLIGKINWNLVNAEIFRDEKDNNLYIKAWYEGEDRRGKYSLCINKMDIPDINRPVRVSIPEVFCARALERPSVTFDNGKQVNISYEGRQLYNITILEEKIQKVTIKDIEEKFGCKIEIVDTDK